MEREVQKAPATIVASPGTLPETAGNQPAEARVKVERTVKVEVKVMAERAWAKAAEKTVARARVDSRASVTTAAYGATRPSSVRKAKVKERVVEN